jgi:Cu+-exporting ATPase
MILDKTGTITEGAPKVTDVLLAEGQEREHVLMLARVLKRALSIHWQWPL